MDCNKCAEPLIAGAKFCGRCGNPAAGISTPTTDDASLNPTSMTASTLSSPAASSSSSVSVARPESSFSSNGQTLSTGGPIIEQDGRRSSLVVVGVLLLILMIGFGYSAIASRTDKSRLVTTECYSFELPAGLMATAATTACSASASDDKGTTVTSALLSPEVTESGLAPFAKQHFTSKQPGATIVAERSATFAAEPAYRVESTLDGKSSTTYYVYDRQASVTINRKQYHGYVVTFSAFGTVDNESIKQLESSWQWLARKGTTAAKTPESSRSAPVSDGNTACFTVTLPVGAEATSSGDCQLNIQYGSERYSRFRVQTLLGSENDLQGYVANWKKSAAKSDVVIISENASKIGIYDARTIIFRYKSSERTSITVIAYTGPKYKVDGYNPDGFEIDGSYDSQDGERIAVDAMLKSWQWK